MKSIAILVIGLLLGALGMLLCTSGTPPAAADCHDNPCANPPCCNGDVNRSGMIDIADAIYLLGYLFAQGPEPEVIRCPTGGLPATGQTVCYGYDAETEEWVEGPCDSAEYPGQDGFYQAGYPMEGRFVDNGDGTVSDTCTGLMWQKETTGPFTWQNALKYCERVTLAGHDDWRLPNLRELHSIVDYGRHLNSIDPVFDAHPSWYWSSSTKVNLLTYAWTVDLGSGLVNALGKTNLTYLRAVRRGP